ncbi:MAG: hypothetical protein U0989_01450 [Azonexus sp.]|nr:hypothetical protein [Azonexus sp.]MDP3635962.1 hypothetical protein [Azonexus sp.]MDZ4313432.1 hypothetical protein [Azonexus sp.]
MTSSAASLSFHINPSDPQVHAVPATVLVQILENAQRAFELIGVQVEGREIRERARVSAATAKRFQLVCHVPEAGSYAMPVTVGGGADLLVSELAEKAVTIFKDVMGLVSSRNAGGLVGVLPDQRIRRRVLESIKGMAPRSDAGWTLDFHDAQNAAFATFDTDTIPFVEATLVPPEQREAARVVTGELTSIDFAARKVSIIYPPTSKILECLYEEAVEDLLYEKRRDFIQVTGRVLLDDQGTPKQIIDVTDIRDLDISPLAVTGVRTGALSLKVTAPMTLDVELDDTKQLLYVMQPDLGIDVFAPTRETLLAELQEQLAMLWNEYALAADDELDEPARQMKQALLAQFAEVQHAA